MPYKTINSTVYTKTTGTWKKKQKCRSPAAAKRALKLLRGLEAGTIERPQKKGTGKNTKRNTKKNTKR